jgi:hypothetical protein
LLYQSNFYLPDDRWEEEEADRNRIFRQDGYYNFEVRSTDNWIAYDFLRIAIADFRIHVDVKFEINSQDTATCGIYFRICDNGKNFYNRYRFAISRFGSYALHSYIDKEFQSILDYQFSEFIRRGDNTNSLMVEMVGQKITLGINGNILNTVADNRLTSGFIGLFVNSGDNKSFVEARFRDFRLYAP